MMWLRKKQKKRKRNRKLVMKKNIKIFVVIVLTLSLLVITGCSKAKDTSMLSSWNDDAAAINKFTNYMADVTDKNSDNFIPVEDRIAVFDLDGTLYCEKQPTYGIWLTFVKRALNDSSYQAPEDVKAVAETIAAFDQNSSVPNTMERDEAIAETKAFAGMTFGEYEKFVKDFLKEDADGFVGMKRANAYYKPMLEIIDYLKANDFAVYICSGTDRFWVRTAIDGVIDIPDEHVIGMDTTLVASNQGNDVDGLDYVYTDKDEVIRGNRLIVKNVKMNKVSQMAQEIGRQPVLAFGNSSGDASMCNYVLDDNPYKSMAFMVIADDTEREYGNPEKADKMIKTCKENGWNPISMKKDWETIYGEGVSKTK